MLKSDGRFYVDDEVIEETVGNEVFQRDFDPEKKILYYCVPLRLTSYFPNSKVNLVIEDDVILAGTNEMRSKLGEDCSDAEYYGDPGILSGELAKKMGIYDERGHLTITLDGAVLPRDMEGFCWCLDPLKMINLGNATVRPGNRLNLQCAFATAKGLEEIVVSETFTKLACFDEMFLADAGDNLDGTVDSCGEARSEITFRSTTKDENGNGKFYKGFIDKLVEYDYPVKWEGHESDERYNSVSCDNPDRPLLIFSKQVYVSPWCVFRPATASLRYSNLTSKLYHSLKRPEQNILEHQKDKLTLNCSRNVCVIAGKTPWPEPIQMSNEKGTPAVINAWLANQIPQSLKETQFPYSLEIKGRFVITGCNKFFNAPGTRWIAKEANLVFVGTNSLPDVPFDVINSYVKLTGAKEYVITNRINVINSRFECDGDLILKDGGAISPVDGTFTPPPDDDTDMPVLKAETKI